MNSLAVAAILTGCSGATPKSETTEDPQKEIGTLRAEINTTEEKIKTTLDQIVPLNEEDEQEVKRKRLNIRFGIHESCMNQAYFQAEGNRKLIDKVDNPPFYDVLEKACKKFDDVNDKQKRKQWEECMDQERIKLLTPQQAIDYFRWQLSEKKFTLQCVEKEGPARIASENMPDPTVTLTDDNFEKETSNGIVIVDFYADWCGPCKIVSPTLTEIAKKYQGQLKVGRIDVDKNPHSADLVTDLGGKVKLPTIRIYEKGQMIGELTGAMPSEQLKNILLEKILKGKIK